MKYVKVVLRDINDEMADMLIALLSDAGFSGFEEKENELYAYIEEPNFRPEALSVIAKQMDVRYITEIIEPQNWNALWESNFEPVIVADFCTIRAHFHVIEVSTPYDILITPKMSFGTGHHATTQLMMTLMKEMDFAGKAVLDFGTGTGVLAILAEKLGAAKVLAIDNDKWSVENAIENVERNLCEHISISEGSVEDTPDEKYDIILANINRHILLQYMNDLFAKLNPGGVILLSGLMLEDRDIILNAAVEGGFVFKKISELNNWIALIFERK